MQRVSRVLRPWGLAVTLGVAACLDAPVTGPLDAPARLLNVHGNAPGALATLNTRLAGEGANIVAQHLQTQGETGYVVTDLDKAPSSELIQALGKEPGFIRTRLLVK